MQAVAARLDSQVEERADPRLLAHVAGAANLHLLEAAEVEVAGVRVRPFGHVDALEQCLVLPGHAVGLIAGLRAGARSAHVIAGHLETGRLRHRGPDIARIRDVLQQLFREVRADRGALDIDDGRFAGNRHGFLQRRQLELDVDRQRLVQAKADVFALERLEA